MWPPLASRHVNGGSNGSGEVERRDVALEVVDGDERHTARPRDRLGGREADEQRADEARPLRHADAVDVLEAEPGVVERRANDGRDELEMASEATRHDSAEPRVKVRL